MCKMCCFYFEGKWSPFMVCVAPFTVSLLLKEQLVSVCRQVSIFHTNYGQLQQSARGQCIYKEAFASSLGNTHFP